MFRKIRKVWNDLLYDKETFRALTSDKPSERQAAWEQLLAEKYERELCAPRSPEEIRLGRERAKARNNLRT